jgi:hypothetical protein
MAGITVIGRIGVSGWFAFANAAVMTAHTRTRYLIMVDG